MDWSRLSMVRSRLRMDRTRLRTHRTRLRMDSPACERISPDCELIGPDSVWNGPDCKWTGPDCEEIDPEWIGPDCERIGPDSCGRKPPTIPFSVGGVDPFVNHPIKRLPLIGNDKYARQQKLAMALLRSGPAIQYSNSIAITPLSLTLGEICRYYYLVEAL
jgi:hypothetical protein